MTDRLELVFAASAASYAAVREALSQLEEDDVSVSSPVSAGAPEAAVVVGDDTVTVRVEGHGSDWTKKSQEALESAVLGADGVTETESVNGGYSPDDSDEN
jgi:hypothetical protein